ncbi:hypothetical protein ABZY81_18195 [Streptomyces sp. NPDC006514]|uniref:hypothetical protein n=1 Tax=Streptomyces sp. NPDC006514 TaxID=3154308 RepID=UPI0033B8BB91
MTAELCASEACTEADPLSPCVCRCGGWGHATKTQPPVSPYDPRTVAASIERRRSREAGFPGLTARPRRKQIKNMEPFFKGSLKERERGTR